MRRKEREREREAGCRELWMGLAVCRVEGVGRGGGVGLEGSSSHGGYNACALPLRLHVQYAAASGAGATCCHVMMMAAAQAPAAPFAASRMQIET